MSNQIDDSLEVANRAGEADIQGTEEKLSEHSQKNLLSTSRQRALNEEAQAPKLDMHLTDLKFGNQGADETANETGKKKGGKPAYLQSLNESEK
jgi:hypothetical protein